MDFPSSLGFLSVSLAVAVFIIFLFHTLKPRPRQRLPPGPPGVPVFGNLLQLDSSKPHIHLWQLSQKYGPIMSMRFGSVPVLVISSPKAAEEALKAQDLIFCSRPKFLGQQKLSYNGLDVGFAPYGDSWRDLRKITVVHLFSNKQVQSFRAVREEEVLEMIESISVLAERGEVANLSTTIPSLTSRLMSRIAIRRKFGGSEKKRFDELMLETVSVLGAVFVSDYIPLFGWMDRVSGMRSRLEKVFRKLDAFYQEIIDEHLDSRGIKPKIPDILDLMIQLREDKSVSTDFSWDRIKSILLDLFIGGTNTSAAAITWAMTSLMRSPEAMNKLQREIRDTVKGQGKVTEDDIPKLVYLKAVVKETLRLYPSGPLLLPRETLKSTTIDGYEVGSGTLVFINAYAIARDPEFWERPEEFLPERFLNGEVDIVGRDFQVIPFGSGRRVCPGIGMALATLELAIANLVYSFNWELPDGMTKEDIDTEASPGLTMHKKNHLRLVPKKYKYSS